MKITTTGNIKIPFDADDIVLGIDHPSIKIFNKEDDGEMHLIFESDYERKTLLRYLECLRIKKINGNCAGTFDIKRAISNTVSSLKGTEND